MRQHITTESLQVLKPGSFLFNVGVDVLFTWRESRYGKENAVCCLVNFSKEPVNIGTDAHGNNE